MRYMEELNAFYDRLLTRPLSANAIALWAVMMHIANRAGWPHNFSVAASTLVGMLGMNERTVRRARAELIEAGVLKHLPQPGRKAPIYILVSLSTKARLHLVDK